MERLPARHHVSSTAFGDHGSYGRNLAVGGPARGGAAGGGRLVPGDLAAPGGTVPEGYPGPKPFATGSCFLLPPGEASRRHRGGPLRLRLGGEGEAPMEGAAGLARSFRGRNVEPGRQPQVLVPGGVWQSAEPSGAEPVLVSCVVAPALSFDDFPLG